MNGQSSIRDDLAKIVKIDNQLTEAVKKQKVIHLNAWRRLKGIRTDAVKSIESRGYK